MFAGQLLAAAAAASALGTAQPNATLGIVGHSVLTGYAPGISQPHADQGIVGHSVLTGYAPDISQPHTDQGITGHSALTGYAPAVALANNIVGIAGHTALTSYPALVARTANQLASPAPAHSAFTGRTAVASQASASQNLTPTKGHGGFTAYAPSSLQSYVNPIIFGPGGIKRGKGGSAAPPTKQAAPFDAAQAAQKLVAPSTHSTPDRTADPAHPVAVSAHENDDDVVITLIATMLAEGFFNGTSAR